MTGDQIVNMVASPPPGGTAMLEGRKGTSSAHNSKQQRSSHKKQKSPSGSNPPPPDSLHARMKQAHEIARPGTGTPGSSAKMGKEEREMIREEKPALKKVLEDFRDRAAEVREKVDALVQRAEREALEDPGPREEGASFLAAKQMLLLSYCRELCSYAAAKGRGVSMAGGGAAGRLLELRTVMEKLRPMNRKLKYQTDKLLRLAATSQSVNGGLGVDNEAFAQGGDDEEDDPLSFRPRPEAMAPWGEGRADEANGDGSRKPTKAAVEQNASAHKEAGEGKSALYRAPRLSSVPYDEDGVAGGAAAARGERRLEKRRENLRRGEVMETLREEFGDQPETVRGVGNAGASGVSEAKMKRLLEEDKERLDFEEDHMVRLTVTRKSKKARARMEKEAGRLETIADVGSAADFVRVARDADGFSGRMEVGEDEIFGGGGSKKKRSKGSGRALGLALGAVGKSMGEGGAGSSKKRRSKFSP